MAGRKVVRGNLAALPFNNFMPHPYTYIPFHMNHPHMPFQMSLFNSTYPSITSCATLYIPFHMNHPHTHTHVKSIQTNTEQFTPSVLHHPLNSLKKCF